MERIVELFNSRLKRAKFIIAGHSMGGALATLFACSLFQYLGKENNNDRQISVITFGAPMCMNQSAADIVKHKLGNELIRFVTSNSRCGSNFNFDIITHLPLSEAAYSELTQLIEIDERLEGVIKKFAVKDGYVHVGLAVTLRRHYPVSPKAIVEYILMIHSAALYRENCVKQMELLIYQPADFK